MKSVSALQPTSAENGTPATTVGGAQTVGAQPAQQVRWLDGGAFELKLPDAEETEWGMDVLRYGAQVEVVGPESLRRTIIDRLAEAQTVYMAAT